MIVLSKCTQAGFFIYRSFMNILCIGLYGLSIVDVTPLVTNEGPVYGLYLVDVTPRVTGVGILV